MLRSFRLRSLPASIAPLAGLGLVLMAPVSRAADANPAAGLTLQVAPLAKAVGQPPRAGSAALARDLSVLRWIQTSRDPQQVRHAWTYLDRVPTAFEPAIGADLSKTAPRIKAGVPAFVKVVETVKDQLKESIARPRPFLSHADLQPCLPLERSKSYPSGHATWYTATSLLLADLLPQRRERLLAVGEQGVAARVTCGVHYPSDVEAGQRLAAAGVAQILASVQWQRFKASVQEEVKALMVPPPAGLPLLFD
ncbi:PAP2 superfamily protein [Synechococcus sp. RS9909]|uniref:phosphatase PAP2 family protein n=1 Tax=unclassified Synechococcus TaxID=2626047 RepID=UPI000068FC9A|nr:MULTISPECIES: phosphatase PAP2 family protein [unclassified Synechococcus]EAQ68185.1 PA-phosphatase related phosphoesterase [Synechococcus sp. RS9917]QNI78652.1 PAP2 superfamily protein [Synechococcus sp. RS9909]